ncbi:putative calcium-binding protein CML41 [Cucumis melo var. makuwa]|uniref:Calcium-binding protein CML41 n=2 Tax=Cucumis melo TaxID=3656 RepID=A0A5A7UHX6_CUCMM|nr:putative calcium-binding protein CML41 [Cucumis melo var. makuwa]
MAISTIAIPFKWFTKTNFKLNFPLLHSKHKPISSKPPTPPPLAEVAFRHLDIDGDGKISGDELRSYFASIGEYMTWDGAQSVIGDFDKDGDELLELGDFERLVKGEEEEQEEDLKRAFEMFEGEKGCGFIGATGLQKMFGRLGYVKSKEDCMTMIKVFDVDGDGVIDYHEFLRMMT